RCGSCTGRSSWRSWSCWRGSGERGEAGGGTDGRGEGLAGACAEGEPGDHRGNGKGRQRNGEAMSKVRRWTSLHFRYGRSGCKGQVVTGQAATSVFSQQQQSRHFKAIRLRVLPLRALAAWARA